MWVLHLILPLKKTTEGNFIADLLFNPDSPTLSGTRYTERVDVPGFIMERTAIRVTCQLC